MLTSDDVRRRWQNKFLKFFGISIRAMLTAMRQRDTKMLRRGSIIKFELIMCQCQIHTMHHKCKVFLPLQWDHYGTLESVMLLFYLFLSREGKFIFYLIKNEKLFYKSKTVEITERPCCVYLCAMPLRFGDKEKKIQEHILNSNKNRCSVHAPGKRSWNQTYW